MPNLTSEQKLENVRRANAAMTGLKAYACVGYLAGATISEREFQEEESTIIGDFLADLQHYCDLNNLDFESCLDNGRMHHQAENAGED